ncbi:MAG: hypothetical protein JW751_09735 [Polyangiaceae bacterium]|nr:hypothetical protein [Polyangiaceae bacterium]
MSNQMMRVLLSTGGLVAAGFVACTSDSAADSVTATGGTTNEGGAGTGGDLNEGGSSIGGHEDGDGAEAGGAGESGGPNPSCSLAREGREEVLLTGDIEGELDPGNVYVIEGVVYVLEGKTLTIPPCTRIEGDRDSLGTLIVTRGGRIEAAGNPDAPILFTGRDGADEPGSWGGVLILGGAPVTLGSDVNVEGLAPDPRHQYGGEDPDDDSGTLEYVRIEYSGVEFSLNNEINGLTLAGVGNGTTIDHVMVRDTLDDCFEWFGGTVDADHLICVNSGDDMFDTDDGYQGTISYVFGQHGQQDSADPNGLEWDGTTDTNARIDTVVTLRNATMCADDRSETGYAMVLRRGVAGQIEKLVAVGFPYGVDLRAEPGSEAELSDITIANSILVADVAMDQEEAPGTILDDDGGLDDAAWFQEGTRNGTGDPGFTAADCMRATPTAAVFDSDVGAFEGDPDWARGKWTGW